MPAMRTPTRLAAALLLALTACGSDDPATAPIGQAGTSGAAGQGGAGHGGAGASGSSGKGGSSSGTSGHGGQSPAGAAGESGAGAGGSESGGAGGSAGEAGAGGAGAGGSDAGASGTAAGGSGGAAGSGGGASTLDTTTPPDVELTVWQGKLSAAGGGGTIVVRLPKGATTKLPLVVFAHGFQLPVNGYDATLTHIAKFGYVVASVDYTQNLFDQDHHAPVDAMKDAITLLTTSPPSAVGDVVDAARVASMGHSLGGKGAVWAALELPAVKAVVALDPVDDDPSSFGGGSSAKRPSLAPEKMASLAHPALYIGAQLSPTTTFGQACAPKASSACAFAAATPASVFARHTTLADFGHMQFLDNSSCGFTCSACAKGSPAAEEPGKQLTRAATVAFLKAELDGDAAYAPYLDALLTEASAKKVALTEAAQTTFCMP